MKRSATKHTYFPDNVVPFLSGNLIALEEVDVAAVYVYGLEQIDYLVENQYVTLLFDKVFNLIGITREQRVGTYNIFAGGE